MGQSSLVLVEPGHIKRLKGVMSFLTESIRKNPDGNPMARMAILLSTLSDEIAEEMRDHDEMTMRGYMFQIGEIIAWIGHGDNERLPDGVRELAEMVQPTVRTDGNYADADAHKELDSATG